MHDPKYFIMPFEQNDNIILSKNGYFRRIDDGALVSFEKSKKF